MDAAEELEAGTAAGNARPPPRQRSSISSFLFICFVLYMLTNHGGDDYLAKHRYQDALDSLTLQIRNFTAWLNETESNFTMPSTDPAFGSLVEAFGIYYEPAQGATHYSNITGYIHGQSKFHNITPPYLSNAPSSPWKASAQHLVADMNLTQLNENLGSWNWTASSKVALSLLEQSREDSGDEGDDIAFIHGRIELTNKKTKEDLKLEFEGIHFVRNGSIYGFAEPSGQHIDIRLLPSLVPEPYKNHTARIILPELSARATKLQNLIKAGTIDQDLINVDPPKAACTFHFYAQLAPSHISESQLVELEKEIQNPTGIWMFMPPTLALDGILVSKDCGILFEIGNTEGVRSATFFRKVTAYAGLATVSNLVLLLLLSRQTSRSHNPAGISRVSRWCFLAQAVVDSISFAGHITFAILTDGRSSLSLVAPAFLACVLFIYEAQFALTIHQIQLPEDFTPVQRNTARQASSPSPPADAALGPQPPNTQTGATPTTPAQSTSPSPSVIRAFLRHLSSDSQARLWLILFICLMFVIRIILSPIMTLFFIGSMYSLFWVPQIWRSATRGRGSGLSAEYLIGTTAWRLFFALYFLACPKNVLDIEPRSWIYIVAVLMFLQVIVIILQEHVSPTFFLPARYVTSAPYDYHPPLPLSDQETPEKCLGDCAICMDGIYLENVADNGGGAGRLLNRVSKSVTGRTRNKKNYSLAPCHHLFHTECLERWLAIKNICPQCRRPLPPL